MKHVTFLCACLFFCTTPFSNAQPSESMKSSSHTFQLARLVLKDGRAKTGWFLGTYRDTLVIQVGGKSERIPRSDLLQVVIDAKPQRAAPALIGMFAGMYAGNALILSAEREPTLFIDGDNCSLGTILYNAAFGLGGGIVGYLVGMSQSDEIVLDFSGSEEENGAQWEELSGSGSKRRPKGSVHFSVQASWVSGPLSDFGGDYNHTSYRDVSSLNMLRKLQLTYSVTEFCDIGIAGMWLGQPSLEYYGQYPTFTNVNVKMSGSGFYAVGVIQPLWKLGWRDVQWDVGVGVGTASIDFKTEWISYSEFQSLQNSIGTKKTTFSAMLNTELKVFVADYFSVGVAADLVYIPEDVPAVEGMSFSSKKLGTSSVGLTLGLHL